MTQWGSRGALLETGGAVLCAGGTWIPVVANGAFRSDDSLSGTFEKIEEYLRMGVQHVWVIDPRRRQGYHFTTDGMREAKDGILRTSNPDIAVPLAALFD